MRNTIKYATALAALVFATQSVHAVPAWPGIHTHTQPDGRTVQYTVKGDEHYHAIFSEDGIPLILHSDSLCYAIADSNGAFSSTRMLAGNPLERTAAELQLIAELPKFDLDHAAAHQRVQRRILDTDGFPTTGNMRGIVILVNYADCKMQDEYTTEIFTRKMNEEGWSMYGATGSVRDYFIAQSSGVFTPTFDVYGPVELEHNYSFYGQNDGNGQDRGGGNMVREACEKADKDFDVDFTKYDYDKDGVVDFVYVIYAGYAESYGASTNTIWPHASTLTDQYINLSLDGLKIDRYACSSELKYTTGTTLEGIGTICHEFGHVIGLPDLYNTRFSGSYQLGSWDVMDMGSYNNDSHTPPSYSAFERYSLGWLELTELDTPAYGVELPELTGSNKAYRISTSNENEYFTLENRQQAGWDAHLPGHGMIVEHIDYDQSAWEYNVVNAGTFSRVDLVEADNTAGSGKPSDPFPGTNNVTLLADYTKPSTMMHDGTPVGKGISNIREENGLITFDFMHDRLAPPTNLLCSEIMSDSFVASWDAVEDATAYNVELEEIIPADEMVVLLNQDFAGLTEGEYPKSDFQEIGDVLESYPGLFDWYGTDLYSCGGQIRIGSYGKSGILRSPYTELTSTGQHTVAIKAHSYIGKKVDFTIDLVDKQGNVVHTQKFTANKELKDYLITFTSTGDPLRIDITTDKERLFVDQIRLIRGDIAPEEVWTIGENHSRIDGIKECRVQLTELKADREYDVKVMAVSEDGTTDSVWSQPLRVTTATNGIRTNVADNILRTTDDGFAVTTIVPGTMLIVCDAAGNVILRDTPTAPCTYRMPARGLYIVRYGTAILKAVVL